MNVVTNKQTTKPISKTSKHPTLFWKKDLILTWLNWQVFDPQIFPPRFEKRMPLYPIKPKFVQRSSPPFLPIHLLVKNQQQITISRLIPPPKQKQSSKISRNTPTKIHNQLTATTLKIFSCVQTKLRLQNKFPCSFLFYESMKKNRGKNRHQKNLHPNVSFPASVSFTCFF